MRVLDFFFALRPLVMLPAWSFFLLGHSSDSPADFPVMRFFGFTLLLSGVYLWNQVTDLETDRLNDKGFFLQRGIFQPGQYWLWGGLLMLAGLGLGAASWLHLILLFVALGLGLAYSLPPLRLSARPVVDLLANALGYGVVAPLLGMQSPDASDAGVLVAAFLVVAAVFLHTTLLDLSGDRQTGKRTTGVWLGAQRACWLALGLAAMSVAASVGHDLWWWPCVLVAALCLLRVLGGIRSRFVVVGSTLGFAVAAGLAEWLFLPCIVVLAALTRWYYTQRFSIKYPSF